MPLVIADHFRGCRASCFQHFILVPFPFPLFLSHSFPFHTSHFPSSPLSFVTSHCPWPRAFHSPARGLVPSIPLPVASCLLSRLWYTLTPSFVSPVLDPFPFPPISSSLFPVA